LVIKHHNLAIENGILRFDGLRQFVKFRKFSGEVVLVAGNQASFAVLDK